MPDAITGLETAGVPVSPVSLKLAGLHARAPVTCTGNVFGPNSTTSPNINLGFPNTQSGDNGMGKIDYQPNSRNTISGLYFFGNSTGTLADKQYVLPQYLTLLHTRAQVANVNWTSTPNSTWVNEVRFGYNRLYNPIFPVDQGTPATTYGVDTGVTNPLLGGLPSISLSGFTALGNGANHPKIIGPDQAFDLVDNISFLHGNHGFKFGGEVRKYTVDEGTFRAARGTIKFGKNAAFSGASPLGLGVIPTGATIVQADGTPGPGTGTIASSAITVPGSQLNWNGIVFANANSVTCGNGLPATSPGTGANPSPCSILGMNRNFTTPYVSTWTLNVQHAFTSNISTQVAYVGNHGSRLPGITDISQAALGSGWTPAAIAAGASDPLAEQASRPFVGAFPYLGFINYINGIYRSNYNGLQATLTARNFHRPSFVGAYTYSHALDDSSENWNQYTPQDSTNPKAQYGNSDWDIRHRFTFSMTYSLPDKKSFAQLLEGWQVNTIVSLQTGGALGGGRHRG